MEAKANGDEEEVFSPSQLSFRRMSGSSKKAKGGLETNPAPEPLMGISLSPSQLQKKSGATSGSGGTTATNNDQSQTVFTSPGTAGSGNKTIASNQNAVKTSTSTTSGSGVVSSGGVIAGVRKGDDGWKEVTRKCPSSRSKKVIVSSSVISRVIGRGGLKINAIREATGAHIEVEKQQKGQVQPERTMNEPDPDMKKLLPGGGAGVGAQSSTSGGSQRSGSSGASVTPTPISVGQFPIIGSVTSLLQQQHQQQQQSQNTSTGDDDLGLGGTAPPPNYSIPFNAITGTDTMMKNGTALQILTRHQCITCMKEHENKSLEELRLEDYQLNRNGPQASTFGGNAAGKAGGSSLNQPKPGGFFGSGTSPTTNTFGGGTGLGFSFANNANQQPSIFGANNNPATSNRGLGTTSAFSFNAQPEQQQQGLNLFGQKPLTTTSSAPTFGSGFGNTATNNTLNKSLFDGSTGATFGQATATSSFGSGTGLFSSNTQQQKPFTFSTPFSSTAQATSQPAFGGPTSSTSTFSFSNPVSTPSVNFGTTAPTFGNTTGSTGTGFGGQLSFSLGSNTQQPPTGTTFGSGFFSSGTTNPAGVTGTGTGLSLFGSSTGNTTLGTGFGTGGLQLHQPPNLQLQQLQIAQISFATSPFKDNQLFYNLISNRKLEDLAKPTNPQAQRQFREASCRKTSSCGTGASTFNVSFSPALKNVTFPTASKNSSITKFDSFDGFKDDDLGGGVDILSPKTDVKKLVLKGGDDTPSSTNSSSGTDLGLARRASMLVATGMASLPNLKSTSPFEQRNRNRLSMLKSPLSQSDLSFVPESGGGADTANRTLDVGDSSLPSNNDLHHLRNNHINSLHNSGTSNECGGDNEHYPNGGGPFPSTSKRGSEVEVGGIFLNGSLSGSNVDIRGSILNDPGAGGVCGVVCTRPGYFTKPSLEELDRSPKKVKQLNYESKLRKACDRLGAEFLSYNEVQGVWRSKVGHFSKYSCDLEENEDDEVDPTHPQYPQQQQQPKGLGGIPQQKLPQARKSLSMSAMLPPSPIPGPHGDVVAHQLPSPPVAHMTMSRMSMPASKSSHFGVPTSSGAISAGPSAGPSHHHMMEGGVGSQSGPGSDMELNPLTPCDSDEDDDDDLDDDEMDDDLADNLVIRRGLSQSQGAGIQFSESSLSMPKYKPTLQDSGTEKSRLMKSVLTIEEFQGGDSSSCSSMSIMDSQPPFKKLRPSLLRQTLSRVEEEQHFPAPPLNQRLAILPGITPPTSSGASGSGLSRLPAARLIKSKDKVMFSENIVEDLFSSVRPNIATSAVRMRGCPRVCFLPNGKFLTVTQSVTAEGFKAYAKINQIMSYAEKREESPLASVGRNLLERQMEARLKETGVLSRHYIHNVRESMRKCAARVSEVKLTLEKELVIWELCDILWPEALDPEDMFWKDDGFSLGQRKRLSNWLQKYASILFGDQYDPKDKSVLGLLKKGLNEEACYAAMEDANYWLATLLTTVPHLVLNFDDPEFLHGMPADTGDIIALISGDLTKLSWFAGNKNKKVLEMNTFEWMQLFALYIWYGGPVRCLEVVVVEQALKEFEAMLRYIAVGDDAEFPLPKTEVSSVANLAMHLLKLYSCQGYPMNIILNPRTSSMDSLVYKLSWLLMRDMEEIGYLSENDVYKSVCLGYCGMLESIGMSKWCQFVLDSIPGPEFNEDQEETEILEREAVAVRFLERNVKTYADADELFLVKEMSIPTGLIDSIKSWKTRRPEGKIWFLGNMGQWQNSFDLLKSYMESQESLHLIGGRFPPQAKNMMKHLLRLEENKSRTVGWEIHGKLLINYLTMMQEPEQQETGDRAEVAIQFLESAVKFQPVNMYQSAFLLELAISAQKNILLLLYEPHMDSELRDRLEENLMTFLDISVPFLFGGHVGNSPSANVGQRQQLDQAQQPPRSSLGALLQTLAQSAVGSQPLVVEKPQRRPIAEFGEPQVFLTISSLAGDEMNSDRILEMVWTKFIDWENGDKVALLSFDPEHRDLLADDRFSTVSIQTGGGLVKALAMHDVLGMSGYFYSNIRFEEPELTEECSPYLGYWIAYLRRDTLHHRWILRTSSALKLESDWQCSMSNTIGNIPLTRLMLPGTHDAGAWEHYHPQQRESRVMQYGICQDDSLYHQLRYGVRYFDLRITINPDYPDNKFWIYHGLHYFRALRGELEGVRRFLTRFKEIIILDFHIITFTDEETHLELLKLIEELVGAFIATSTKPITALTPNDLWSEGKTLLITYPGENLDALSEVSGVPLRKNVHHAWAETRNLTELVSYIYNTVQNPPEQLVSIMAQLTPGFTDWVLHRRIGTRVYAHFVNIFFTLLFQKPEYYSNCNIVSLDFYKGTRQIQNCILVNKNKRL